MRKAIKWMRARSDRLIAFKEFPGRTHFTVGQDGWEEVADYALDWAKEVTANK